MRKNKLYLIVGPSGVGKNTLLQGVLDSIDKVVSAVSLTTRDIRPGEVAGLDYHFTTREQFETRIKMDMLLQYVEYAGNYYGLPKDEVDRKLASWDVLAVVEPEGAKQLKAIYSDAQTVFLRPPSAEVLIDRMIHRGDSRAQALHRMMSYDHFMSYMPECDYIVNSGVAHYVLEDVTQIIKRNRL